MFESAPLFHTVTPHGPKGTTCELENETNLGTNHHLDSSISTPIAMTNLIGSAKSASDWNTNDLSAYNINITFIQENEFFPTPDPSLDHLDPAVLTSPAGDNHPTLSDIAETYLGYLDHATAPQERIIHDFAATTLSLLGYNERGTTISTRFTIPFTICGQPNHVAEPEICLISRPTFVLLVLIADKPFPGQRDPEAEVVAEAIAAFQFNNTRRRANGLDRLDSMTIPCIIMSGTVPTFYPVPVTTELSNAVVTGQYTATQTQVAGCRIIMTPRQRTSTDMEDVQYRQFALKRFLAFKSLAKSHWVRIIEGI